MNPGYLPHETNYRISELHKTRAKMSLEAEAMQSATTETAPARRNVLRTILNLLNHLMPLPGRVSSSDAMP